MTDDLISLLPQTLIRVCKAVFPIVPWMWLVAKPSFGHANGLQNGYLQVVVELRYQ